MFKLMVISIVCMLLFIMALAVIMIIIEFIIEVPKVIKRRLYMEEETVTISKKEYDRLLKDSEWLRCLEEAGYRS